MHETDRVARLTRCHPRSAVQIAHRNRRKLVLAALCRIAAVLLVLWPLSGRAADAAAEASSTIVVMNFQVGKGVDEATVKLLNDLMLAEFQRPGTHQVFGEQDMISMMNLEETKVQTGCTDDACLAEIGGALGARYLVSAALGRVGAKFLVNLKMIDVEEAKAVGRSSQIVEGEEDRLLSAVKAAVAELLASLSPGAQLAATATAPEPAAPLATPAPPVAEDPVTEPAPSATLQADPPSGRSLAWDVGAWGTASLAVALLAGATASAVLASQANDDREQTPLIEADRRSSLAADTLFGLAGAAALTSVLLFVLMPDEVEATSAGLSPVSGGAVLGVRGSWPPWEVRQ